jgi:hypothetical protein
MACVIIRYCSTPTYYSQFMDPSRKCSWLVPFEHVMDHIMTFVDNFTEDVVGTGLFDLCHTCGGNLN